VYRVPYDATVNPGALKLLLPHLERRHGALQERDAARGGGHGARVVRHLVVPQGVQLKKQAKFESSSSWFSFKR